MWLVCVVHLIYQQRWHAVQALILKFDGKSRACGAVRLSPTEGKPPASSDAPTSTEHGRLPPPATEEEARRLRAQVAAMLASAGQAFTSLGELVLHMNTDVNKTAADKSDFVNSIEVILFAKAFAVCIGARVRWPICSAH